MILTRLFCAIAVPTDLYPKIFELQSDFESKFLGKTPVENLHITLKFYGDADEAELKKIIDDLKRVKVEKFLLKPEGLGLFGDFPRHVVYIRIRDNKKLNDLRSQIYKVSERPETTDFQPHITICRTKLGIDKDSIDNFLERNKAFALPSFELKSFGLFSSTVSSSGHRVYKQIEEFFLE